jgi:hypothetical protein
MSFWTPAGNPGTHPLRSRAFDIGCALFAADCLLCCGLPVGRHCFAAQQIHGPDAPSRLGRALRERMPILSKTCPRWNSTALTVT